MYNLANDRLMVGDCLHVLLNTNFGAAYFVHVNVGNPGFISIPRILTWSVAGNPLVAWLLEMSYHNWLVVTGTFSMSPYIILGIFGKNHPN